MKKEEALKRKEELTKKLSDLRLDIMQESIHKTEYLNENTIQAIRELINTPVGEYVYSTWETWIQLSKLDYEFKNENEMINLSEAEINKITDVRAKEFEREIKSLTEKLHEYEGIKHNIESGIDRLIDMEMEFDGDIIITDPCYVIRAKHHGTELLTDNDWSSCNYGSHMEVLGINTYMTRDTLYGDWSCTTYDLDTKEEIGSFCADAGLVSVFLLDEVMKYNPDYKDVEENHWSVTCIRDFKGTVEFRVEEVSYEYKGEMRTGYEVKVYGHGINKVTGKPINFIGTQTGL